MKNIIYFLFLAVFIVSCGSDSQEFSLTFVYDKAISEGEETKYPKYIQEISTPFKSACKIAFLPKPINIIRLDISNNEVETNAWHFASFGQNTVEFSKGWLEQYFNDSTNAYLSEKAKKTANVDNWIEKNKTAILFILSEDAEIDNYKDVQVFNSAKDLYKQLQIVVCEKSESLEKILVLVNPAIIFPPPVVDPEEETIVEGGDSIVPPSGVERGPKPPPAPKPRIECKSQVTASNLNDYFNKITASNIDDCRKTNLVKSYTSFLEANATIIEIDNNGTPIMSYNSVTAYISHLRGRDIVVKIDESKSEMQGGKYSKLYVREP
jgi:hypothetical protein